MKLTDNEYLREQIFKRMKELGWKDTDLIKDADERGVVIEASRWTKYKKNKSGQITDGMLMWIAARLYIPINVRIGKPSLKEGKIEWEVPVYNELEALKLVKQIPKPTK